MKIKHSLSKKGEKKRTAKNAKISFFEDQAPKEMATEQQNEIGNGKTREEYAIANCVNTQAKLHAMFVTRSSSQQQQRDRASET